MSRVRVPEGVPLPLGCETPKRETPKESDAKWPVGQVVKTAASHAANGSSTLPRVTIFQVNIGMVLAGETWLKYEVGADCGEGPPVPIPNTAVKLTRAENTWLATAREDR